MTAAYAYSRVDEEEAPPTSNSKVSRNWYQKPSVVWLLPTFLLFNLAMGATAMPKMNVLISLICRRVLAKDMSMHADSMQNEPRHGGYTHTDGMAMNGTTGNFSSSVIIIGEYNPQCATKEIESAATMLNLWGNLIAGILGAVAAPLWGKLSDRYGRIRILAAAAVVFFASEVLMVLIARFPDALALNWVYLTFVLEGFSGSFILIMALASSYAADCTQLKDRNVALGWFHGSMFFGMAVGPVAGGFLGMSEGKSNPLLIFYTALGMRAFAIVLLALVPESLESSNQGSRPLIAQLRVYLRSSSRGTWSEKIRRINPLRLLTILSPSNAQLSKPAQRNLLALASVNTILFGAVMGAMNVMMLYSEFRFSWGNKESGIFLSTINIFRTLATVAVLPLVIKISRRYIGGKSTFSGHSQGYSHGRSSEEAHAPGRIETLDILLLRVSIASDMLGYIGYAISPTGALFTLSGAIAALGAIGLSTSEASMTKLLPASQTGELLGALGFLQAMARIVAPTAASLTYSWTTAWWPQLVFWGIAVSFSVAGALTWFVKVGEKGGLEREMAGEDEYAESLVPLQAGKVYD
ncbi:tetracycline-efflux transporter-like protein [Delitschia confertaspora ATCC 74209]|uniref:Tetracycline-efflux transporter-like protein n=1 Tax=Delitschia confertaspora ATCC 74209 TaxID=1513339 RepID=A0A9P4MVK4_9PLEO|nr:tetracycline-efflux transporter-like protein [Delitschia confertaspora ATCC 74209]